MPISGVKGLCPKPGAVLFEYCLSLQFLPTGLWPARFHSPYINQVNESFHVMQFVDQTRRHRRCHAQRLMHLMQS